ncbi:hypothetical protein [Pseudoxanthomonas winnipegensis]|uniref:hypothetical protein n=1 Tax=Pseudoxanthomonas winnipegensis TaxID=2480810 RepID=UPI001039791E|nr:hypothetical protein [Pseudoxanthomonas winnipegensis]TBV73263.1 hypothetical protein EYC45_12835 [Pseudoxanthomonas winnipegensis]
MRIKLTVCIFFVLACCIDAALAEPTSARVVILDLRPYAGSEVTYLHVNSTALCNTDVFIIDASQANGKQMYAAALTAVASGKEVALEVANATGCTGFGTKLQSIYIFS